MEKPQSGTSVFLLPSKTTVQKLRQNTLKGVANLIKLLPTGTVFLFQFLNPVLTNNGYCPSVVSKTLTGILHSACGLMCCISSFTDSYTGGDGKIHYALDGVASDYPIPFLLLGKMMNTRLDRNPAPNGRLFNSCFPPAPISQFWKFIVFEAISMTEGRYACLQHE